MPTELEELVGFLAAPQTHIRQIEIGQTTYHVIERQIAIENLVGYTAGSQNVIFKPEGLKPIKNLMFLVRDKPIISINALKSLVNLSEDPKVVSLLASDASFLELLLSQITNPSCAGADYIAMLLTNMSKDDSVATRILDLKREKPKEEWKVSDSEMAMDQLMDLFVKGEGKTLNKEANFDYLAYFFADVARHPKGRLHFLTKQAYDDVIPLSKIVVFTEHKSLIRRKGVASTIKNTLFETSSHSQVISEDDINLLPYILLPIMGSEEYSDADSANMPAEMQLLPPDKERESDTTVIETHLESLMLLTTTRSVREKMREVGVYPVVREVHLAVDDEAVKDVCERLVDVLQRDEAPEGGELEEGGERIREVVDEEEEDEEAIVDIV